MANLTKKQVGWICDHLEFIARLYESSCRDHRDQKARAFRRVVSAINYEAPDKLTLDQLRSINFVGPSIMNCLYEFEMNSYNHHTGYATKMLRECRDEHSRIYAESWLIE